MSDEDIASFADFTSGVDCYPLPRASVGERNARTASLRERDSDQKAKVRPKNNPSSSGTFAGVSWFGSLPKNPRATCGPKGAPKDLDLRTDLQTPSTPQTTVALGCLATRSAIALDPHDAIGIFNRPGPEGEDGEWFTLPRPLSATRRRSVAGVSCPTMSSMTSSSERDRLVKKPSCRVA